MIDFRGPKSSIDFRVRAPPPPRRPQLLSILCRVNGGNGIETSSRLIGRRLSGKFAATPRGDPSGISASRRRRSGGAPCQHQGSIIRGIRTILKNGRDLNFKSAGFLPRNKLRTGARRFAPSGGPGSSLRGSANAPLGVRPGRECDLPAEPDPEHGADHAQG
jgi:hypothetical protein